ncbi:MAG: hypothetical protein WCW27_06685 [Patescibacteria group bacterium]
MYKRLPTKTAKFVDSALQQLEQNPFNGNNIKHLRGELEGCFRFIQLLSLTIFLRKY